MARTLPALIRWPEEGFRRVELAEQGRPCVLVVEPGHDIPTLREAEDWVYRTADERDVAARLAGVSQRAQAVAAIASSQVCVSSRLLAAVGALVLRSDLHVDDLDEVIEAIRPSLAADGWTIHEVGDVGFLIERSPT